MVKYLKGDIMKIVLIGCTSKKMDYPCKAVEMYSKSSLFNKELDFAKNILQADKIFILSAKHHLLPISKVIEPYDKSLNDKGLTKKDRELWAKTVFVDLEKEVNANDEIIFLCGQRYYEFLKGLLEQKVKVSFPLMNIGGIGKQLNFLTESLLNAD